MSALPTYKGYVVDFRLREFRKVTQTKYGPSVETIPFNSEKGDRMLATYIKNTPESRMDEIVELFG